MKFEIVKWFGEDWKRETFESLCERKASLEEFAYNGFIQINERPERLNPEDEKVIWSSVLDEYPYQPFICDSLTSTNK